MGVYLVVIGLVLAFAFGTIAWPYAKYDFSEPLAALAILVAAASMYRAFLPGLTPTGYRGEVAVVVVACFVAVAAKYAAAFAVAALATEWVVVARPWASDGANRPRALAFGLAVTMVWLYVEILRILSILRGND